ncbi:MAG: VOC family protein [Acidimicrobiia bacterium]|nr:VOC family protein [Acidimicrobiia bacterium]
MTALAYIVLDVNDLEKEAAFWSQLLEVEVAGQVGQYVILKPQAESGIRLSLQQVDEPKQGKNRMHVDFHVTDLEAATGRAIELGATRVDEHRWPTFMWRVFQDPEGNEFCIATELEGESTDG